MPGQSKKFHTINVSQPTCMWL